MLYQHVAETEDHRVILERAHELAIRQHRDRHANQRISVQLVSEPTADPLRFRCCEGNCKRIIPITLEQAK